MRWKGAIALVALLVCAAFVQSYYDRNTDCLSPRNSVLALPSGNALKVFAFGFDNLLADCLYVWAIQYYSSYHITNRFDNISHVFNSITDLLPRSSAPYMIGAMIMAMEAGKPEMALELLEKGSRNMPEEWLFEFDAAFYANKYLSDPERAESYFKSASERPGAPAFLRRRWAHMVYLNDDSVSSYNLWLEIYRNASTDLEKNSAVNHLYQIKSEIDIKGLNNILKQYKMLYGSWPPELVVLAQKGLIRKVPVDFHGREYLYDIANGKVSAKVSFKWKTY